MSSKTGASSSGGFVSYRRYSLGGSYSSAKLQSLFSTAPAEWAESIFNLLHYSQTIFFPTHSCLFLYLLCASLRHLLVMWITVWSITCYSPAYNQFLLRHNSYCIILRWEIQFPSLSFLCITRSSSSNLQRSVDWGGRIRRLHLCRGVRPRSIEYPVYDTKKSDSEAPEMLKLWGMQSTPPLPLFLGSLW